MARAGEPPEKAHVREHLCCLFTTSGSLFPNEGIDIVVVDLFLVNKYILFHDTFAVKTLQDVIDEFVKKNYTDWALVEYYQENVGYTLIKRIGNAR